MRYRTLALATITLILAACPAAPPPVDSPNSKVVQAEPASPAPTVAGSALWPAREVTGYDPRTSVALSEIPDHGWDGDSLGSEHYADVMAHTSPGNRFDEPDTEATTIAHESHHGLQFENSQEEQFFYLEHGFGVRVPQPKSSLRQIRTEDDGTPVYTEDAYTTVPIARELLPAEVAAIAAGRYETYLIDEVHATDGVLYLFDEWNAYLASARIAIELEQVGYYAKLYSGRGETHIDALDGMVDFLYFSAAGALALAQREPDYFASNQQLRALFALFAEETVRLLEHGRAISRFSGFHAEQLFQHFAGAPENQAIRELLSRWLGPEFCQRVFGF